MGFFVKLISTFNFDIGNLFQYMVTPVQTLKGRFPKVLKQDNWRIVSHDPAINQVFKGVKLQLDNTKEALSNIQGVNNELERARKAASLKVTPPVYGTAVILPPKSNKLQYGFLQEYGGKTMRQHVEEGNLTPKQMYYLGHQTGRIKRRLATKAGFVPLDIHGDNLVIRNHYVNKPKANLIDLEMSVPTEQYRLKYTYMKPEVRQLPPRYAKPFLTGYELGEKYI